MGISDLLTLNRMKDKLWPTLFGLICSIVLLTSFFALLKTTFPVSPAYQEYYLVVFLFALSILIYYWWRSRLLPKFESGKTGILLIIRRPEDEEDAELIKSEFIDSFKNEISNTLGHIFSIKEVSTYQLGKINSLEKASIAGVKSNATAIIYGVAKVGPLKGKKVHVIELFSQFRHPVLSTSEQERYQNLVNSSYIPKYIAAKDNSMIELEMNSKLFTSSIMFILAQAAIFTRRADIGEGLLRKVIDSTKKPPYINYIKANVIKHFSKLMLSKANYYYQQWKDDRLEQSLNSLGEALSEVAEFDKKLPGCLVLTAIYEVATRNNISGAIELFAKIPPKHRDGEWFLNTAFLYFIKGNLPRAFKRYMEGIKKPISDDLIIELEQFMVWYRDTHNYMSIHLLLAILNLYVKKDLLQAELDYEAYSGCENIRNASDGKIVATFESDLNKFREQTDRT